MFMCKKCGRCCRNIDKIPELKEYDTGDGVCIYLTKKNLCCIYPARPDVCNVERMFEVKYKELMSWEKYERLNEEGCKLLQTEYTQE